MQVSLSSRRRGGFILHSENWKVSVFVLLWYGTVVSSDVRVPAHVGFSFLSESALRGSLLSIVHHFMILGDKGASKLPSCKGEGMHFCNSLWKHMFIYPLLCILQSKLKSHSVIG